MAAYVDKPKEVNEVIKVMNDPGYDELQEENTWLRGSLRELSLIHI